MRKVVKLVCLLSVAWGSAAQAAMGVYPMQVGAETVRYRQGVPTLDLDLPTGAIQITPLPFDHGHVAFGIGVYNKAGVPANFGVENVQASIGSEAVPVLSVDELQRRAKSRAMWTQIGFAVLAGAAAGIASTATTTNHYHGVVRGPYGGAYAWHAAYRDNSVGVLGATAASAAGIASIAGVQNRLDYTLANLANDGVQTTTVGPDASYGGRIVLEKPKGAMKTPCDVQVVITWNGSRYPFSFKVASDASGAPPALTVMTPARPLVPPIVFNAAPVSGATPNMAAPASTQTASAAPISWSRWAANDGSVAAAHSHSGLSAYELGRAQAAATTPASGPYGD